MNWNWPDMVLGSGQCRGSTSGRRAVLLRQSLLQGPRRGSAATGPMPADWDVVGGILCRNAGTGIMPSGICPHCIVGKPRALLSVGRVGG